MKVFDIEITKAVFSEDNGYKILFDESHGTELSQKTFEPIFQQNKFQFSSKFFNDLKEYLTVELYTVVNEVDTKIASELVEINYGKEAVTYTCEFNKARGSAVDGMVQFTCKLYKQALADSLKNTSGLCCLSVNAAFLNVQLEKPFDFKIHVKNSAGAVVGVMKLNNKISSAFLDLD